MSDPTELLRANRRRRAVRRWALIASAPLLLLALLFCAKVLSMYAFAHAAAAAHAVGDHPGTTAAARGQEWFNVFEPYKAPFNVGVGLTASGDLEGGRAAFEHALTLAVGLEQCAVRANLAITLERIGDAAAASGDGAGARSAWEEGLAVLRGAPEGCHTPEADDYAPDPEQNTADTLAEEERRLLEKLQQSSSPEPSDDPQEPQEPQEPQPPVDQEQLDAIEDLLQEGTEEREDQLEGDDGGGWTDQPW